MVIEFQRLIESGPPRASARPGRRRHPVVAEPGGLVARDKCSLDLSWLKDDSLLDAEDLPDPDEIAQEIADDLTVALAQIEEILGDLQEGVAS